MYNRMNIKENALKEELTKLMTHKKSKDYYSKRLGVPVSKIEELFKEIKEFPEIIREYDISKKVNVDKGEIEVNTYYKSEPTPEQVIQDHKIDITKYKLVQFWSKAKSNGWYVSAMFKVIESSENYKELFISFLKSYKPFIKLKSCEQHTYGNNIKSCLIINPQDIHYDKYDRKGNNNIYDRFDDFTVKIQKILKKASATSNIEKIIYIIGSDEYNSEWTNQTTHGTPQQNVIPHSESFTAICEHEVNIISLLHHYSTEIEVLYIPGNHDLYASWYMIKWLEAFFRVNENIKFNTSDTYTKYIKYSNSALCFNHGYKIKPELLAHNFPIEFKNNWSSCDNYYIFVGDLHTDLSKSIGGIQFYRLAQASNAISKWDEENGYTLSKGTVTGFLIEEYNGITDIYKC